jgi:hypothetical protein
MKKIFAFLMAFPCLASAIGLLPPSPLHVLRTRLPASPEGQWLLRQLQLQSELPSLFKSTKDSRFFNMSLANMCLLLFERHCQIPHIRSEFLLEYDTEVLATGANLGKPYTPHLQFFFHAAAIEFEIYKFMTTSTASAYEGYDFANLQFYLPSLKQDFPTWFTARELRLLDETVFSMEQQAIGCLVSQFAFVNQVIHRKFTREVGVIVSDMLVDMTKRLREEGALMP